MDDGRQRLGPLLRRYHDSTECFMFKRSNYFSPYMVQNLVLDLELKAHSGCVNCLDWDSDGRYILSGSDDHQVAIFDNDGSKFKQRIKTRHNGNIFSVKFMPFSDNSTILTGAADTEVQVHDISGSLIRRIQTHVDRVKRLATIPNTPSVFISSGEDGYVYSHDLRDPNPSVLVHLMPKSNDGTTTGYMSYTRPIKSIAVNPAVPFQLAVASGEPLVRVYDRRMINLTPVSLIGEFANQCTRYNDEILSINENVNNDIIMDSRLSRKYCPGHLMDCHPPSQYHATHVAFSQDGRELLLNLGSEQIYLFDVHDHSIKPFKYLVPEFCLTRNVPTKSFRTNEKKTDRSDPNLSIANNFYQQNKYSAAIIHYNMVIERNPRSAVAYANRAAAYIKRGWNGDTYDAMIDCIKALSLDPDQYKAHFRLAKCLHELKLDKLAEDVMATFRHRFPDAASTPQIDALQVDIYRASESQKEEDNNNLYSRSDRTIDYTEYHDYTKRFYGHQNSSTDIKEASFLGERYIAAGSDDGCIYIWNKLTMNIERIIHADSMIVNCVLANPTRTVLATSGIDDVVRVWRPKKRNPSEDYMYTRMEMPNESEDESSILVSQISTSETEESFVDEIDSPVHIGLDEASIETVMAINQSRMRGNTFHDVVFNLDVAQLVASSRARLGESNYSCETS